MNDYQKFAHDAEHWLSTHIGWTASGPIHLDNGLFWRKVVADGEAFALCRNGKSVELASWLSLRNA